MGSQSKQLELIETAQTTQTLITSRRSYKEPKSNRLFFMAVFDGEKAL